MGFTKFLSEFGHLKKRSPSSGQNSQLVHWWLLVHSVWVMATLHLSTNLCIFTPSEVFAIVTMGLLPFDYIPPFPTHKPDGTYQGNLAI